MLMTPAGNVQTMCRLITGTTETIAYTLLTTYSIQTPGSVAPVMESFIDLYSMHIGALTDEISQ